MNGEIRFPAYKGRAALKVRRISEVKIESSWSSLTDTAEIKLPRRVKDFDRKHVSDVFREGDPVEIWLGYNDDLVLEFTGYISKVPAGVPLTFSCENEMYKLKRTEVSISMQNCTLKKLLQTIAPGYDIVCDETKLLGTIRYPKQSASSILDDLRKAGISCFFVGKTLHAMDVVSRNSDKVVSVLLERTAGESLKQKAIEDTLVIIELARKIGKSIKVEYGDVGAGKRVTKKYSGINYSKEELLDEAKLIYKKSKVPGFDGDLILFGIPRVHHGMTVQFRSIIYPEKNGKYYIDAVTKTFNRNGYRQQCKLGDKAI